MAFAIPGGNSRGTPLESATTSDIEYWRKKRVEELERDPNGQYAMKNRAWVTAADAELTRRANGGAVAAPPPAPGAIPREEVNRAIQQYSGAHTDAAKATQALAKLQEIGHLLSPAPACGVLPMGTALSISAFLIDVDNETFALPGSAKRGLGKVALEKFASALCVSWSPECHRIDDRSDAHYAEFSAVGYSRNLDGSRRRFSGEKVMDLREGSPQVEAMRRQSESKFRKEHDKWAAGDKKDKEPTMGDWDSQLRDLRFRIAEHAETKAKLRAIRSLGLRPSYTKEELAKPFFTVSLQFTGQSDDPVIRKMFADRIADAFLGGGNMLYGRESSPEPQRIEQQTRKPQPIDTTGESLEDEDGIGLDDEDDFPI